MSRTYTIDLDNAEDIETLWAEYARVRALRDADPELRCQLEALLPKIDPPVADEIRAALDETTPYVVLCEWEDDFFRAKFGDPSPAALGAFAHLRRQLPPVDPHAETLARIKAEPLELGPIVAEMLDATTDLRLVVKAALTLAEEAGIEGETAEHVVSDAIRKARHVGR